jgi:hypothetical protein
MRLLRIVLCVALAATLAACSGSPPTSPTPTAEVGGGTISTAGGDNNNGAVVHHGEIGCAVVDGNGEWFPDEFFSLPCGTEVATFSKNLNAKLTVHASGVPNDTGKTVHWGPYNPGAAWVEQYPELSGPPYPCFIYGTEYSPDSPLFTVKWHATVTPSGEATLVCIYQKKWEMQW